MTGPRPTARQFTLPAARWVRGTVSGTSHDEDWIKRWKRLHRILVTQSDLQIVQPPENEMLAAMRAIYCQDACGS